MSSLIEQYYNILFEQVVTNLLYHYNFSAGTAQIVKLADSDMSRTNVFAKIAIRQILKLSMSELPKKLTIPFELEMERIRYGS